MEATAKEAKKTKEEGDKFLSENKTKQGVITTASGLQYKVEKEGTGVKPTAEDKVKVNYTGTLLDGTKFDSSVDHDGVRPFVTAEMIDRCFLEAQHYGAAIPILPLVDSLREIDGQGSHPVNRSRFVTVQTPQVFDLKLLLNAYGQPYSPSFTDDASVVESFGHPIATVEGCRENIKITTPFDLSVAASLFNAIQ